MRIVPMQERRESREDVLAGLAADMRRAIGRLDAADSCKWSLMLALRELEHELAQRPGEIRRQTDRPC